MLTVDVVESDLLLDVTQAMQDDDPDVRKLAIRAVLDLVNCGQ